MSESAGGDSNHFACCKRGLKENRKKESGAQRHRFEGQGRYNASLQIPSEAKVLQEVLQATSLSHVTGKGDADRRSRDRCRNARRMI
jgi:hypothetical protein